MSQLHAAAPAGDGASLQARTVLIGEGQRPYFLAPPPADAAGIVVNLHGRGVTPQSQADLSGTNRLGAAGAVVAYPQGSIARSKNGYSWDQEADVAYLDAVIAAVRAEFPEAPPGVCLAGLSEGGRMASHYASVRAEEVGVLAAVAGLRAPRQLPARPVPVIAFHGLADAFSPYAGRGPDHWYESVPEAAGAWATANGVGAEPEEVELSPTLKMLGYAEGSAAEVMLWVFAKAGHTWPGSHPGRVQGMLLGRTSSALDATREIWAFFQRHQAPGV
ncbi:MAG: alpha/beta hydrolase family esterase [Actinomycetota bacterium]